MISENAHVNNEMELRPGTTKHHMKAHAWAIGVELNAGTTKQTVSTRDTLILSDCIHRRLKHHK